MGLLSLVAAALLAAQATPSPPSPHRALVQATASVRILSGERVSADNIPEAAIVRDTRVRGADGSQKPARLVEFP